MSIQANLVPININIDRTETKYIRIYYYTISLIKQGCIYTYLILAEPGLYTDLIIFQMHICSFGNLQTQVNNRIVEISYENENIIHFHIDYHAKYKASRNFHN